MKQQDFAGVVRPGAASVPVSILAGLFVIVSGCAGQNQVNKRAGDVLKLMGDQRESLYNCAPAELATAESLAEIAKYESSRGRPVEAVRALDEAEKVAGRAYEMSREGRCLNDADKDTIPDRTDACPNQPEDPDGFEDADGCPDPDNDKDGVPDVTDKCRDVAGPSQNQGCPIVDTDADGVPDKEDKCPKEKGPSSNRGCPFVDSDGDGLLDPDDKCPMESGPTDNGGCPYRKIEITEKKIELHEKVFFATGKTTILQESWGLLDEVAQAMKDHPTIKVDIEGHTDDVGNDKTNLKLSQGRAESVRKYLISRGVGPERMRAVGYGETRPIDDNSVEEGRSVNRRVEFVITSR